MRVEAKTPATVSLILVFFSFCLFFSCLVTTTQMVCAQEIVDAIERNDTHQLICLLRNGEDPNSLRVNGLPAVLFAWQHGHINTFEILLEMGASPHDVILEDLQISVEGQLISIDRKSPVMATIIQYARLRPSFSEVALRYLRIPNQTDGAGRTVFHIHASANLPVFGSASLAALILNGGVDPNLLDNEGLSAVRLFVRRFIDPVGIAAPEVLLKSGIHFFAAAGCDLFQVSPDETTLLEDLVVISNRCNRSDGVEQLVWTHEKSASLQKFFDGKKHPSSELLLTELRDANLSLVSMFDDPSAQDVSYWAERFPDVFPGRLRLHDYLEAGGSIDEHGKAGFNFLWASFHAGNAATFAKLLLEGANPDHRLTENLFEYHEKIPHSKTDIVFDGFFAVRGETVLLAACSYPFRRKEFIRPALAVTKEVNQTDELDRNLLHRLLYHPLLDGQEELLQDLISAGVDLNAQTISGATPCHVAVAMNPTVIPALVEAGSDPSIQNMHDQTVEDLLRLAIQEGWSRKSDYQNVLDWLNAREK